MIAIASGGKAQYDDQLGCFAAYTATGDVRAKTLDDLAALVPLTAAEREELAAEKAQADAPADAAGEVARLAAEKAELEAQIATLSAVKAEMQDGIRADILKAVQDALKG